MTYPSANVSYNVSDHLVHRHPYREERNFAAHKRNTSGKVFDGLRPGTLTKQIEHIGNPLLDPIQKAAALQHLIAHSAAPEAKIDLLQRDVVPLLASLLLSKPPSMVEASANKLLRSIAVVPQGCSCIVAEGGLAALATSIGDAHDSGDRSDARLAALRAVKLMAASWAGRGWILGQPVPGGMSLPGREPRNDAETDQRRIAATLCGALVGAVREEGAPPGSVECAVEVLALLTADSVGRELVISADGLQAVVTVLNDFGAEDSWVYSDDSTGSMIVRHAATVIWHCVATGSGADQAVSLPLMDPLTRCMACVLPVHDNLFELKGALLGALGAATLNVPMKAQALDTMTKADGHERNAVELALMLLVQASEFKGPAESSTIGSVIVNAIQAVRLVAELPRAREWLHAQNLDYSLRQQLFYKTSFQQEFAVDEP